MKTLPKRSLVLIILLIVTGGAVMLVASFSREQDAPAQNTDTPTSYDPRLSRVNPEERNTTLVQAGLPYENDQYAITYRYEDSAPNGVVIIVVNKQPNVIDTKSVANEYFAARGIDLRQLKTEYRTPSR